MNYKQTGCDSLLRDHISFLIVAIASRISLRILAQSLAFPHHSGCHTQCVLDIDHTSARVHRYSAYRLL